jgi:hypothetical protein
MTKTNVLMLLLLLPFLASCANEPCPKRPPFGGKSYGDALAYLGVLEVLYDSCSA